MEGSLWNSSNDVRFWPLLWSMSERELLTGRHGIPSLSLWRRGHVRLLKCMVIQSFPELISRAFPTGWSTILLIIWGSTRKVRNWRKGDGKCYRCALRLSIDLSDGYLCGFSRILSAWHALMLIQFCKTIPAISNNKSATEMFMTFENI